MQLTADTDSATSFPCQVLTFWDCWNTSSRADRHWAMLQASEVQSIDYRSSWHKELHTTGPTFASGDVTLDLEHATGLERYVLVECIVFPAHFVLWHCACVVLQQCVREPLVVQG